jgi:hypothetical protein
MSTHITRKAKAEGARAISGQQDGSWGGRIHRALDLEDRLWETSHRGSDLAVGCWQLTPGLTRNSLGHL